MAKEKKPKGERAQKKERVEAQKNSVALERLVIEHVPVDSIHPNEYNPNRQSEHDFELLCRSIEDDGFTQPVVVLRESRKIVDGEHRYRACKKLGFANVPVVFVDMTPAQARMATLRHNRARGSEDAGLAAEVLRDLMKLGATDWAQDALMLDDVEVKRLAEDLNTENVQEMIADLPEDKLGPRGQGLSELDRNGNFDTTADQTRAKEKLLSEAKAQEERQMAQADRDFRLILNFAGDEAELLKAVLGDQPAPRLLEICRAAAAS